MRLQAALIWFFLVFVVEINKLCNGTEIGHFVKKLESERNEKFLNISWLFALDFAKRNSTNFQQSFDLFEVYCSCITHSIIYQSINLILLSFSRCDSIEKSSEICSQLLRLNKIRDICMRVLWMYNIEKWITLNLIERKWTRKKLLRLSIVL